METAEICILFFESPCRLGFVQEFISCLKSIKKINISRYIFGEVNSNNETFQFHGFCDSSQEAYCAVVYIRIQNSVGISVDLLTAKSTPRLELLSCLLLAKLMSTVLNALKCKYSEATVKCWTDSEIALCWITGIRKQWTSLVESRVTKIRNYILPVNWRHVPGGMGTRNVTCRDLLYDSLWFTFMK